MSNVKLNASDTDEAETKMLCGTEETDAVYSAAVCEAVVPPETEEEYNAQLKRDTVLYGALFKRATDMEYFSMLPLQPAQKKQLVERMIELKALDQIV